MVSGFFGLALHFVQIQKIFHSFIPLVGSGKLIGLSGWHTLWCMPAGRNGSERDY